MKNILKYVVTLYIVGVFMFNGIEAHAQTADVKGCGNPGTSCCSSLIIGKPGDVQVNKNIVGNSFDFVVSVVNSALNTLFKPVNQVMNDFIGQTILPCSVGVPSTPNNPSDPKCVCLDDSKSLSSVDYLCKTIKLSSERDKCSSCLATGGIWSGIGCIKSDTKSFIEDTILKFGIGLAGGISLLCIIFSAFQMQTSRGNAEKLKKAQELLTNCITGLMVIIFSMLILKIIGVDILRIPGFS